MIKIRHGKLKINILIFVFKTTTFIKKTKRIMYMVYKKKNYL